MADDAGDLPRLYRDLSDWYRLLTPPEDYAEEAEFYRGWLTGGSPRPVRTVLELGAGAGHNASHLKAHFSLTLVDVSAAMLALSRELNPGCEHIEGDMRSLRLGRVFDAVFLHDAVDYMRSEDDLRRAMETAFLHCAPGGVALFVPDCVRETFLPGTETGGTDRDGRGLRYLEWSWDPDPADTTYVADMAILTRDRDGTTGLHHDRHEMGLFSRATWLALLQEAGFGAERVVPGPAHPYMGAVEMFLARKTAPGGG